MDGRLAAAQVANVLITLGSRAHIIAMRLPVGLV